MEKLRKIFNRKVRTLLLFLMFAGLIGFTEVSDDVVVCKSVKVQIHNDIDNHFLDEEEVKRIATKQGERFIEGEPLDKIDLKAIEKDLEKDPYIANGEIYKDLDGNIQISVTLRRPIARIFRTDGPGGYVTEEGFLMPVSSHFVSRVMMITGPGTTAMIQPGYFEKEEGKKMLDLMRFITEDELWKAQIAEMEVSRKGKVTFLPQVTRQRIEFGYPEDIEHKFTKLRVFYKKVLPVKGWNTYDKVNLEFKDQIVAE